MLLLHLMAKTYSQRPSTLAGISDEWAAYQFDAAVLLESLDDDKGRPAARPGKWRELVK